MHPAAAKGGIAGFEVIARDIVNLVRKPLGRSPKQPSAPFRQKAIQKLDTFWLKTPLFGRAKPTG